MRLSSYRSWRRVLHLLLLVACLFVVPAASADPGQGDSEPAAPAIADPAAATASSRVLLPVVHGPPRNSWRLGYGSIDGNINRYPEIGSLRAGWFVDWTVSAAPVRPAHIEYVQTIRIHQKLRESAVWDCTLGGKDAHDRIRCPYATPYEWVLRHNWSDVEAAIRANPGALWLIGNEMDRRDWPGGGQDEMLPEVYARAYHKLYWDIKSIDRARVAIGGVIQATDLRLEYLTRIWDTYRAFYAAQGETEIPVDVWNVHNFILQEKLGEYGADIPPGIAASQGVVYPDEPLSHISRKYFDEQIREFRRWMKVRGQQNKPLIVSEYGVLYSHVAELNQPATIHDFMLWTFDYFLNTKDCSLGYAPDDCRLVQRWAWYSLDDPGVTFNKLGSLFDYGSRQITGTGAQFRTYSLSKMNQLDPYRPWW